MSHPFNHAKSSARKFGGELGDYLYLHEFMDHTKSHLADARHRLFLHNSWGIFIAERVFGNIIRRESDNREIPTRTIIEQHIIEDLGFIPTLEQCVRNVPVEKWMYDRALKLSLEENK